MSKINICSEFCYQPPLTRWAGGWHEYFFKDPIFNIINFLDADPIENNYLHLFCVPDETIQFLEKQDKTFYDQLLKKNFKILFTHEGFELFSQRGEEFKQDFVDIDNILYWRIIKILEKNHIKEENIYFIHSGSGYLEDIERLKNEKVICKNSTVHLKSHHGLSSVLLKSLSLISDSHASALSLILEMVSYQRWTRVPKKAVISFSYLCLL
jgi:hypothetical protein